MDAPRLPLNIADLLHRRVIESERIEFKAGWNPEPILHTLCAFANDFQNLGGGYIVIGVEAEDGEPSLPPRGVPRAQIDGIQQELLRLCNLIQPAYFPVVGVETYQGRELLVLWAPGGQSRPYKAPKKPFAPDKLYQYFIRRYTSTVVAKDDELHELISLAASVPFDDRINHHADLNDLKLPQIQAFLREVKSDLLEPSATMPFADLCRQMAIVDGGSEYLKPRNAGLLFFNDRPERFFPLARIEVVHFLEGVAGDRIDERIFVGPVHLQVRDALAHLRNVVIRERVVKRADRAEADRFFNYPFPAIEEALVNAVYHRSYELREPIEVRINPEGIEILSFPGPDESIQLAALNQDRIVARRYRNRRVGDFLKELKLTEGRGTGIPKIHKAMATNGSPRPRIETDERRSFFLITLPIHPAFLSAQRAEVQDGTVEVRVGAQDLTKTETRILVRLKGAPAARSELATALGFGRLTRNLRAAIRRLRELGLIAYTVPDKPNSKVQQYRLTPQGSVALDGVQVGSDSAQVGTDEVQVDPRSLSETETRILAQLEATHASSSELAAALGYERLTGNLRTALRRLRELGLVAYTVPDKPNSKVQRYRLTAPGRLALRGI